MRSLSGAPLVLGVLALLMSVLYMLQRFGSPFPDSFERFVQFHLDSICGLALLFAVAGAILGLCLGGGVGRSRLLIWGTLICVAAIFAQLLMPL